MVTDVCPEETGFEDAGAAVDPVDGVVVVVAPAGGGV